MHERATRLAHAARWGAANRALEADLRSDLAAVLVPFAVDEAGVPQGTIRQEGTGTAGRFDALFGDVLVEYKRPRLLRVVGERAQAARQALQYLDDPRLGARAVIVTDGETCGFLRGLAGEPEIGEQGVLAFGEPQHIPAVARFTWRAFDEDTARALLELIAAQRAAAVSPGSVIAFLGTGRAEVVALLRALIDALRARTPEARTDTLLGQWVRSAGISYGIDRADAPWPRHGARKLLGATLHPLLGAATYPEAVYALHTYVALASKTIAAEVLAVQRGRNDLRPSEWPTLGDDELVGRLRALERGEVAEQLAAPGLLAADLFDWYAHDATSNGELRTALRDVLRQLGALAWAEIAAAGGVRIDLLRELYQSVVPGALRRALGEFFTPRWLAERTLQRALELHREAYGDEPEPAWRMLDPTCGSGTFLVARLARLLDRLDRDGRGQDPEALLGVLDTLYGIDINPVGAIMARVNLLLTLGDRAHYCPRCTSTSSRPTPSCCPSCRCVPSSSKRQ